MFSAVYNQTLIDAVLVPDGPLLVRAARQGADPTLPDMQVVRTRHGTDGTETVYLPGASLKGVIRAHAERLLRSVSARACPVFRSPDRTDRPCVTGNVTKDAGHTVYRRMCHACRTFGSTGVAGRVRISDAYPTEDTRAAANRTEMRNGVGIDRRSGAAARRVLYDLETVVSGSFSLRITLENHQLWQLALVLQVLMDMDDGLVHVGGAKSRGFGAVRLHEPAIELRSTAGDGRIHGVATLCSDTVRKNYDLAPETALAAPEGARPVSAGLFTGVRMEGWEAVRSLMDGLVEAAWNPFVQRAARKK